MAKAGFIDARLEFNANKVRFDRLISQACIMKRKPARLFTTSFAVLAVLQVIFIAPAAALANKLPNRFEANYTLEMYGITLAEATHKLKHTDNGLSMEVNTRPVGLLAFLYDGHIDIHSDIAIDNGQLLLVNHDYTHTDDSKDTIVRYEISRIGNDQKKPKEIVTGKYKGEQITINSDKPVWDPLSIQALIIINADKETASYEHGLLMKGELKHYTFENLGREKIKLNGSDITALKTVVKEAEKDRVIYVWMLPEYYNIPVKYEHWKDGDLRSTLLLQNVTFENNGKINTLAVTHSTNDEHLYEDW